MRIIRLRFVIFKMLKCSCSVGLFFHLVSIEPELQEQNSELRTLIDPSQFMLAANRMNCAGPLPPNNGGRTEKGEEQKSGRSRRGGFVYVKIHPRWFPNDCGAPSGAAESS
jgi:hypothetical protein